MTRRNAITCGTAHTRRSLTLRCVIRDLNYHDMSDDHIIVSRDLNMCYSRVDRGQREHKGSFRGYPKKGWWCGALLSLVSCYPRSSRDLPP